MGMGLFAAAVGLDLLNNKRADSKRDRLSEKERKILMQLTNKIQDNSVAGGEAVFGEGRQARYAGTADRLEAEIGALMAENTDNSNYASSPYGAEAARRISKRLQDAVDMKRLIARYAAPQTAQLDDRIALADTASVNRGYARQAERSYGDFIEDYNDIQPNPVLGALASGLGGYALGSMYKSARPPSTRTVVPRHAPRG